MGDKIVPIRSGKRRRPIWFDIEDRERLVVRMTIIFQGYWESVNGLHKKYPSTGFTKKVLKAAAMAKGTGTQLMSGPGFMNTAIHDVFGMLIKELYVDKNGWIDNLWVPTAVVFKGKLLWDTLTPDLRSKEKWKKRLQVCGKKWSDVELGQDTIVKITARLCEDILGQKFREQALDDPEWSANPILNVEPVNSTQEIALSIR